MEIAEEGLSLTGSKVSKGFIEALLVPIAQDRFILSSDLLERAQDNQQEPCIAFRYFIRMPIQSGILIAVLLDGSADCRCRREGTGERQVDPRREIRVDKAAGVADDAGVWARVAGRTVRPIGRGLDAGTELGLR